MSAEYNAKVVYIFYKNGSLQKSLFPAAIIVMFKIWNGYSKQVFDMVNA